jgi:hypothetical protein
MASDAGMDELVQDDIVGQLRRHDGQERVELDAAGRGSAAPDSRLAADAQEAGAVAMLAGQGVEARCEKRPGEAAVETLSRQDRLTAAAAGAFGMGQRAPDPAQLGKGDTAGFLVRHAPGDRDTDSPGAPDGQRNASGPPGLFEQHGAKAVENESAGICAYPHEGRISLGADNSQELIIRRPDLVIGLDVEDASAGTIRTYERLLPRRQKNRLNKISE